MAKLNSETIEIKISELLKDNVEAKAILDDNLIVQLFEVIETLVGEKRLVEVTRK